MHLDACVTNWSTHMVKTKRKRKIKLLWFLTLIDIFIETTQKMMVSNIPDSEETNLIWTDG